MPSDGSPQSESVQAQARNGPPEFLISDASFWLLLCHREALTTNKNAPGHIFNQHVSAPLVCVQARGCPAL